MAARKVRAQHCIAKHTTKLSLVMFAVVSLIVSLRARADYCSEAGAAYTRCAMRGDLDVASTRCMLMRLRCRAYAVMRVLAAGGAQYAKVIQRLGFPATFKDFKVQNIVGSTDVRFPIRLEGLSYSHGLFCSVRTLALPRCGLLDRPGSRRGTAALTCSRPCFYLCHYFSWPMEARPVCAGFVYAYARMLRALELRTGGGRICQQAPSRLCLRLILMWPAAQYEPELFPGLIYRMKEPKVVLLIFVSGKVVLTGAQPSRPHPGATCWRAGGSKDARACCCSSARGVKPRAYLRLPGYIIVQTVDQFTWHAETSSAPYLTPLCVRGRREEAGGHLCGV